MSHLRYQVVVHVIASSLSNVDRPTIREILFLSGEKGQGYDAGPALGRPFNRGAYDTVTVGTPYVEPPSVGL